MGLTILYLLDKQAEDQPKSPGVTGNVDLITLDMPRQDVEKPVVGVLTSGSARGIPRRVVMSRDSPRSERNGARNTKI